MMDAQARVVRVGEGKVWLRLEDRPGGCGRCDEPGGCRATRLADVFKFAGEEFCLPDSLGSKVGDGVAIAVPEGAPLRAAVLGYVLPLGSMLVSGGLGLLLAPFASADANVLAGVVVGLTGGVMAGRWIMGSGRWRRGMDLTLKPGSESVISCVGRP